MKIQTFLMFAGKAEEAMGFYTSLFPDSKIIHVRRYGKDQAGKEGSVESAEFSLNGQVFSCIDSPVSHEFTFTPSISIQVKCDTDIQAQNAFDSLATNGTVLMPCGPYPFAKKFGWVTDRYGVSWQLSYGLDYSR